MIGFGYAFYALPTPWARIVLESALPIFATGLCLGYVSTIILDVIGLWRRKLIGHAWVLAFTPLHWLLLSLAAWRALIQLLYDPQRWEKTEHGLAKNSRLARLPSASSNRQVERGQRGSGSRRRPLPMPKVVQIGPGAPIAPMKLMQSGRGAMFEF